MPPSAEAAPPPLRTRPLFSLVVSVDRPLAVGGPPGAGRRIGNIPGGRLEGDRLRGVVLPGGADWQVERGDGAIQLDARILLQTDDGALIAMTYGGLRHGPADVIARLACGEPVDPATYYFRITATFATADRRYEWLNRVIAVGTGHRLADAVRYAIDEIL